MLRLIYTRARDKFQEVSVLGDADGIRDLYWQLTQNYNAIDGTAIGSIRILNLDGDVLDIKSFFARPYAWDTKLSKNMK